MLTLNRTKPACLIVVGAAMALPGCAKKTTVVERPDGTIYVTQPASSRVVVSQQPPREVITMQPAAPPPAPTEDRTVSPAPDYVWVPGAYEWRNGTWEWVPGHWMKPMPAGAVWEPGHWEGVPGGWAWVHGHWR